MANKNNKGNGSLIFTWVLIVLLAVGTFFVYSNYSDNTSDLFANEEIGLALAETLDKPIGRISEKDFDSIEGILFYKDLPFSYSGTTVQTMSAVEFHLNGYKEALEAYNKEGLTDEEKAKLVSPDTLTGYIELTNTDILEDIKKLTSLKSLLVYNYGDTDTETDMLAFAAENFKALDELVIYGYTTNDFGVVSGLTELTSLSIVDETVSDISAVKNLTKLEVLAVNGKELTDISAVAGLTALKNLSISGTSVEDVTAIAGLKNLEQLDLSQNKIKDIAPLATLDNEKLQVLYITGNEITDWSAIAHIDEDKVTKDEPEVTEEVTVEENTEA